MKSKKLGYIAVILYAILFSLMKFSAGKVALGVLLIIASFVGSAIAIFEIIMSRTNLDRTEKDCKRLTRYIDDMIYFLQLCVGILLATIGGFILYEGNPF